MSEIRDVRETQRLDKWLWHARIVKTRSLAAQLVTQGKCRINREKVSKPSHLVRCGDVLTAAVFGRVRILQVTSFSARRGPASEARLLYVDLTPAADEGAGEV
jgi:ribosome-associated heat shock protein Hsp15